MLPLIIQLISGAVGGSVAGALMKNFNLGLIGNSIAGPLGGGLGGQLLSMLTSGGASTAGMAATGSGMDVASILSSVAGGGVGGAVVMAIVGLTKAKMAKPSRVTLKRMTLALPDRNTRETPTDGLEPEAKREHGSKKGAGMVLWKERSSRPFSVI